jgi:hypothetical protein
MAAEPGLTDQQRHDLEAALAAALIMIYNHHQQAAFAKLGAVERGLHLSPGAMVKLNAKAREVAASVQAGVSQRLTAAQNEPDPATATDQAKAGIHRYNDATLIPYLVSFAAQSGLTDAYAQTPSDRQGVSMRDAVLWVWDRTSGCDFDDPCGDAQDASPASYDELMAITGSCPPLHRRCACQVGVAS